MRWPSLSAELATGIGQRGDRRSVNHQRLGWALPIDPSVRCLHMGDIHELGNIVAGAFAFPDQAGHGEYLPLVGDFMSFDEIVATLNQQGHHFSFIRASKDAFTPPFPRPSIL